MLPTILAETDARVKIETILRQLGEDVCDVLADFGGRIVELKEGQRFSDVSPVLRRIVAGVDAWPIPPAGLFVVEERTVYLRSFSPMTIAHELMHMVDCAMGGGVYLSGVDPRIRRAFASATAFCTPYAASACDEYWAECARAFFSINDANSLWPRATRQRLESIDERMYEIVKLVFEVDIPTSAAAIRERASVPQSKARAVRKKGHRSMMIISAKKRASAIVTAEQYGPLLAGDVARAFALQSDAIIALIAEVARNRTAVQRAIRSSRRTCRAAGRRRHFARSAREECNGQA